MPQALQKVEQRDLETADTKQHRNPTWERATPASETFCHRNARKVGYAGHIPGERYHVGRSLTGGLPRREDRAPLEREHFEPPPPPVERDADMVHAMGFRQARLLAQSDASVRQYRNCKGTNRWAPFGVDADDEPPQLSDRSKRRLRSPIARGALPGSQRSDVMRGGYAATLPASSSPASSSSTVPRRAESAPTRRRTLSPRPSPRQSPRPSPRSRPDDYLLGRIDWARASDERGIRRFDSSYMARPEEATPLWTLAEQFGGWGGYRNMAESVHSSERAAVRAANAADAAARVCDVTGPHARRSAWHQQREESTREARALLLRPSREEQGEGTSIRGGCSGDGTSRSHGGSETQRSNRHNSHERLEYLRERPFEHRSDRYGSHERLDYLRDQARRTMLRRGLDYDAGVGMRTDAATGSAGGDGGLSARGSSSHRQHRLALTHQQQQEEGTVAAVNRPVRPLNRAASNEQTGTGGWYRGYRGREHVHRAPLQQRGVRDGASLAMRTAIVCV